MAGPTAMFFLMLISSGAGSFSMQMMATYDSRPACTAARDAVKAALGAGTQAEFDCLSAQSLGALQDANR